MDERFIGQHKKTFKRHWLISNQLIGAFRQSLEISVNSACYIILLKLIRDNLRQLFVINSMALFNFLGSGTMDIMPKLSLRHLILWLLTVGLLVDCGPKNKGMVGASSKTPIQTNDDESKKPVAEATPLKVQEDPETGIFTILNQDEFNRNADMNNDAVKTNIGRRSEDLQTSQPRFSELPKHQLPNSGNEFEGVADENPTRPRINTQAPKALTEPIVDHTSFQPPAFRERDQYQYKQLQLPPTPLEAEELDPELKNMGLVEYKSIGPLLNHLQTYLPSWNKAKKDQLDYLDYNCADCPPSIASLISYSDQEDTLFHCQGSLVDDDLVLTSRHCIPDEYLIRGGDCKGKIQIIFHKMNHQFQGQVVGCEKIVNFPDVPESRIKNKEFYPDWAIIQLDTQVPERVVPVRKTGVKDREKLHMFVPVTQFKETGVDKSEAHHALSRIECESIQGSYRLPEFYNDHSTTVFKICNKNSAGGHSGSGMYSFENNQWTLVSVFSGGVPTATFYKDETKKETYPVSSSVNSSCIENLVDQVSSDCHRVYEDRSHFRALILEEVLLELRGEVETELAKNQQYLTKPFEYQAMEESTWGLLPTAYRDFFNYYKETDTVNVMVDGVEEQRATTYAIIPEERRYLFAQALAPHVIRCVNKSYINHNEQVRARMTIPETTVLLERNIWGYFSSKIKVNWVGANLYQAQEGYYFISPWERYDFQPIDEDPSKKTIFNKPHHYYNKQIPACD